MSVTLDKCHLTKQSTFKSNFKFWHVKCCWTAAHTKSFWEHLPLGSNKLLPDHGLKFPGNSSLSSPVLTPSLCSSPYERRIDPCVFRDRHIQKDLSAVRISSSSLEYPQLLHYKFYLPSSILSSLSCSQYTSCPVLEPTWWNSTVPILNSFFFYAKLCWRNWRILCFNFSKSHLIPIKSNIPIYGVSF